MGHARQNVASLSTVKTIPFWFRVERFLVNVESGMNGIGGLKTRESK